MPRNQPRTSSRSRQSTQPVVVQEDSLDEQESPSLSKNRRRSPRNLDTGFQKSSGGAAARVTRSLTRGSKGEPDTRDAESDEEESESEPEVTSRKRRSKSARKGSPKKRGRTAKGSPGKGGKKKGRPARRTRKQESEDEESEESLDLGESEEEEEKAADDDDEEEVAAAAAAKPEATPAASRRGQRGGTRSSGASNTPASNKATPSVVLERVENVTPSSGRPTRGRGVKQRKAAAAAAQASNSEDEEEERATAEGDEQTPASRTSSRSRRGRTSAQQSNARKTRQQPAKSEKMVPSEENPAALTTETVAKEEQEEKPATDKEDKQPLKETTEKQKEKDQDAAAAAAPEEEPDNEEEEEKMEVDEPAVQSTDEVSEGDSEPATEKEKSGKHKLDESKDEESKESSAPAEKKSKTEEVSESKDAKEEEKPVAKTEATKTTEPAEAETKMEATESAAAPKEEKDAAASVAEEKTEEKKSSFQDGDKKEAAEDAATAPATETVANGEDGEKKVEEAAPAPVEPRVNGSASDDAATTNEEDHKTTDNGCDLDGSIIFASLGVKVPRRCVPNSELNDNVGKDPFTVVSFNLAEEDWTAKHQNLVNEVLQLSPSILCLQEIDEVYFKSLLDSALKSHGYMGLYKAGKASAKGLATFYLLSSFEILHQREFEVHELLEKDVESTTLVDTEKEALKSFLRSPAPVLITKLKAISNGKTVTVGTVNLPSEDETVLAIQVAAVLREIHNIGEGAKNPHVLCGSFNLTDDSIVYQLLRDGILKNEILDELKKNANVPVPEKENASLAKLLEPCLQHPLSSLKSSYGSVLGHELKFPDKTQKLSKDSLWFSSDSLLTKSILDVGAIAEKPLPNTHISLKAELGFVN